MHYRLGFWSACVELELGAACHGGVRHCKSDSLDFAAVFCVDVSSQDVTDHIEQAMQAGVSQYLHLLYKTYVMCMQDAHLPLQLHRQVDAWHLQSCHTRHPKHKPIW